MQNNFPYLDTWPNFRSKLCSMMVLWVWIFTVKVIFDEVQFQTKKSNFHFGEYQFLSLKFSDFPLLNLFETLSDVISSPKPLPSEEFDSFYNNGDRYRPVSVRAIKKFKISGTISFNWKITLIEQTKIYKNNFAPHYSSKIGSSVQIWKIISHFSIISKSLILRFVCQ